MSDRVVLQHDLTSISLLLYKMIRAGGFVSCRAFSCAAFFFIRLVSFRFRSARLRGVCGKQVQTAHRLRVASCFEVSSFIWPTFLRAIKKKR